LPYSAQSELHHWAPGDFLFQIQNLPSGSLGIRRKRYPGYINVGAVGKKYIVQIPEIEKLITFKSTERQSWPGEPPPTLALRR